jgi:oligoendopeptidase F
MTTIDTATETDGGLPRWDTEGIFPGLASREWAEAREAVDADVARLVALADRYDIRGGRPRTPTEADLAAAEELLVATNQVLQRAQRVQAYVYALVTTDATDDEAAAELAGLQAGLAPLSVLDARTTAWFARLGPEALIAGNDVAAQHAHLLRRSGLEADHLMSEDEEALLADLRLTGGTAWSRLAGDLTSRLSGELDGETEPITVLRGVATDPDRDRRHRAYQAEVAAWRTVASPMAACLNGIKGEAVTVNRRRHWEDALAPALWANAVTRPALEAMQAAAVASFPDFRRFLWAKARLLGSGPAGLAWWDLLAPVPGAPGVTWQQAGAAVSEAFGTYSPQLQALVTRALGERWVDAGPRSAKRGGAFCMPLGDGSSRVLLNFDGSFDSVQTLAHELGHAYHNTNLADRPPLQRSTPMALAETASIFCETLMIAAGLETAGPDERLALLNVDLQGACQVVVDIHSRFLFESDLFAQRETAPLSVDQLSASMTAAQAATYGDGVDPTTYHPFMWAVKPHYYGVEAHFYNWPYCFGLLFGIGLFARYREDPDRFRTGYDHLLASTGTADAAELAGQFGIDIADERFWTSSLDVIRGRIDEFVGLVDSRVAP